MLVGAFCLVALTGVERAAVAYNDGSAGHSGKAASYTCAECHISASSLAVTITGPAKASVGEIVGFSVALRGPATLTRAGFGLAASDGTLLPAAADDSTQLLGAELAHAAPKAASAGSASWVFRWKAPQTSARVILYAGGILGTGDGSPEGDAEGVGQAQIIVEGSGNAQSGAPDPPQRRMPDDYYGGCAVGPARRAGDAWPVLLVFALWLVIAGRGRPRSRHRQTTANTR